MTRGRILRSVLLSALVLVAALWFGLPAAASSPRETPVGISVDVSVEPMDAAARTQFMCRARVAELDSGRVLMAPNLQVMAGRSSIGRTGDTGGGATDRGHEVVFTAKVETGGGAASYSVEYSRGGTVVAKQTGSLSLVSN